MHWYMMARDMVKSTYKYPPSENPGEYLSLDCFSFCSLLLSVLVSGGENTPRTIY